MLNEFFKSSSGLAPIRQGLGLGSIISILSGVAILLGAKGAAAHDCDPPGESSNSCSNRRDCLRYSYYRNGQKIDVWGNYISTWRYDHKHVTKAGGGVEYICEYVPTGGYCAAPSCP